MKIEEIIKYAQEAKYWGTQTRVELNLDKIDYLLSRIAKLETIIRRYIPSDIVNKVLEDL